MEIKICSTASRLVRIFSSYPTLAGKCGFGKPSGDGLNGFFFRYDEMEFSRWTMAVTVTTGRTIAKQ